MTSPSHTLDMYFPLSFPGTGTSDDDGGGGMQTEVQGHDCEGKERVCTIRVVTTYGGI